MNTVVYSLENNKLKRTEQKNDELAVTISFSKMMNTSCLKKNICYGLLFICNLLNTSLLAQTDCLDVSANAIATCDASQQCWAEAYEGENNHAFYLPALYFEGLNNGDTYIFGENEKGIFTEYADGTAHLTGTIANTNEPNKKMILDVWFEDKQTWNEWYPGFPAEPTDYYKGLPENVQNHYLDWSYYTIDVGINGQKSKLIGTGDLSGELYLEQNFGGEHFWSVQVGQAANDKNANYGISAWFFFSGTMVDNTTGTVYDVEDITGDINADLDCSQGACNGIIDLSVNSGTPPYSYAWSDGTETMQDRLGLCCGEYSVTITDNENCEIVETFAVENCENEPTITNITPNCLTTCITEFAGSNYHAFWLDSLEGTEIPLDKQYTFENEEASFERFPDGTAHLTGTIISRTDDNRRFEASVWFKDKRNWTEWQAFAADATWKGDIDIVQANYLIWSYYLIDDGEDGMKSTLTGIAGTFFEGTTLYMRHNYDTDGTIGFQVGKGANDNNGNYGASGWMLFNGVDTDGNVLFETDQLADINVDFCESCTGTAEITLATNASAYDISIEPYVYFSQSGNTININYACEGDYELILIDDSGCANTTTVSIPLLECCDVSPPTVTIDGDSFEICENDAIPTLQASSDNTPNAIINWYDETNTLIHTGSSFVPNDLQIGENNYIVEAVGNCTSYPTNFTIILASSPTVVELQDAEACAEDLPYMIDAGNGFDSYLWSNNETTQIIEVTDADFYSVTVTDNNCTAEASMTLTINVCTECPAITSVSASVDAICSDGVISLTAELSNGDEGILTWYNSNDEEISDPNAVVLTTENCGGETMSFYATYEPTNELCTVIQSDNVEISVFPVLSANTVSQSNDCFAELTPSCDSFTATWEDTQGNTGTGFSFTAETGTSGNVVFTLSNPNFPNDFTCLDVDGNGANEISLPYNCSECPAITSVSASVDAICSDGVISLTAELSNGDEGILTWYNSNDEEISDPNAVVLTTENCGGETMSFYATYEPTNELCTVIQSDNVEISVFPVLSANTVSQSNDCFAELTPSCDSFTATWEDTQGNTGTGFSFTAETGTSGNVVFTLSNPNFPNDFTCLDDDGNALNEISLPYNCSECPAITSVSASVDAICSDGVISLTAELSNGDEGILTWYNSNDEEISDPNAVVLTTENCGGETMSFYATYEPTNELCTVIQSDNVEISVFPVLSANTVSQSNDCFAELTPSCDSFTATWEDTQGNTGTGFSFTAETGTSGNVVFTLSNPNFPNDFTCLDDDGNALNEISLPYNCSECPAITSVSASVDAICSDGV
ncbi:MAG: SprB repeat-containing protein, partial [Chitinophagales bacterium]